MKTSALLFFLLLSLVRCSEGKIEYERTENSCFHYPSSLEDGHFPLADTVLMGTYYEDSLQIMNSSNEKLIFLFKNGEQLKNEAKSVYLINTSTTDIIYYTVKTTFDDNFKTSNTQVYKTNPGEKVFIGCDSYIKNNLEVVKQKFEIVGERRK